MNKKNIKYTHPIHNELVNEKNQEQYHCPMKCEGEKVYDEPDNCPVCNMHLVPVDENNNNSQQHHKHIHETHTPKNSKYYCPMHCEGDKIYDKPGDCPVCGMHLKKEESVSVSTTIYTCPMHPEVKQNKPGACHKCGMTLVLAEPTDNNQEEIEYRNMLKKFRTAVIFTLPVFLIAMLDMVKWAHLEELLSIRTWNWIQMILSIPVVLYAGGTFFKRGISSVKRRSFNMWTLISLGVGAAFGFSVFGLLFPGVFPDQFKDGLGIAT